MAIDAVDRARLRDIARLQAVHRTRGSLSADERGEMESLVRILLRRHAGTDSGAPAAAEELLYFADAATNLTPPTIDDILALAEGKKPRARRQQRQRGTGA